MFKKIIFIVILFSSCLTKQKQVDLKNGKFEIYENGRFMGNIYRLNNYQVEEYGDTILYCKLEWLSEKSVILSSIKKPCYLRDSFTTNYPI